MAEILKQLELDERAYQQAAHLAEALRAARNATMREALKLHTHAEVARALGVTRSRVGQIALKLRDDRS